MVYPNVHTFLLPIIINCDSRWLSLTGSFTDLELLVFLTCNLRRSEALSLDVLMALVALDVRWGAVSLGGSEL